MSDDFVSAWIHGGIGNQLFQIANAINYSDKTKKKLIFKNDINLWNYHGLERKTAWDTLFSGKLNVIKDDTYYNSIQFHEYKEQRDNMHDDIPYIEGNVYLRGYFQTHKYINDVTRNKMNDLVYSNNEYYTIAKMLYDIIKNYFKDNDDNNYVFLHMRRTDYVGNNTHNLLSFDYYKNALCHFNNNIKVVLFSDDIEWCKYHVNLENCYPVDIKNHYVELILMSFYKNGIIANSTFSWWGAYLGNKDKRIIAPKQWYATTSHVKKWDDMYLNDWILI